MGRKFEMLGQSIELFSPGWGWFTIEGSLGGTGGSLFLYMVKVKRKGW